MANKRIKDLPAFSGTIPNNAVFALETSQATQKVEFSALKGAVAPVGSKSVTANGTYVASSDNLYGYNQVSVNVPNTFGSGDNGKVVQSGALVAQTSRNVAQNGTYDTTTNNQVVVNVTNVPTLVPKTITANGTYQPADDDADGYSQVIANVPNTYVSGDEGKVVSNGALVAQTSTVITQNGIVDTTTIDSVTVNVSGGGGDGHDVLIPFTVTLDSVDSPNTTKQILNENLTSTLVHLTTFGSYSGNYTMTYSINATFESGYDYALEAGITCDTPNGFPGSTSASITTDAGALIEYDESNNTQLTNDYIPISTNLMYPNVRTLFVNLPTRNWHFKLHLETLSSGSPLVQKNEIYLRLHKISATSIHLTHHYFPEIASFASTFNGTYGNAGTISMSNGVITIVYNVVSTESTEPEFTLSLGGGGTTYIFPSSVPFTLSVEGTRTPSAYESKLYLNNGTEYQLNPSSNYQSGTISLPELFNEAIEITAVLDGFDDDLSNVNLKFTLTLDFNNVEIY